MTLLRARLEEISRSISLDVEQKKSCWFRSFNRSDIRQSQILSSLLVNRSDVICQISDSVVVVESIQDVLVGLSLLNTVSIIDFEAASFLNRKLGLTVCDYLSECFWTSAAMEIACLEECIGKATSEAVDVIVSLGGGRSQDLAKFVGLIAGIPVVAVPTSLASHVYASEKIHVHQSIREYGFDTTIDGKEAALAVISREIMGMLWVEKPRLILSGFGDMMALVSARHDWLESVELGKAEHNRLTDAVSLEVINQLSEIDISADISHWICTYVLNQVLLCNMTHWSGSAPASGAEHLFAKAAESLGYPEIFHGEWVALGVYIFSQIRGVDVELVNKLMKKFRISQSLKFYFKDNSHAGDALKLGKAFAADKGRYTVYDRLPDGDSNLQAFIRSAWTNHE